MIRARINPALDCIDQSVVSGKCARRQPPALPGGREAEWSVASGQWLAEESRPAPGVCTRRLATSHWPLATIRRGFTLVELLITISIIGIMASMVLFAMFQAQETAKEHRTRALITKLNTIIMRRYDEYRTRRVPFAFPAVSQSASTANQAAAQRIIAKARIDCLRDLMRLEMPDRWSDVTDAPVSPFAHGMDPSILQPFDGQIVRPAVNQRYLARYNAANSVNTNWPTFDNQGAECLYMIVMESLAQEGDARDFFKPGDIADVDGDQCPEFVDAWGQPIQFIRWAPGYQSELQSPIRLTVSITQQDAHTAIVDVLNNQGPRLSQTPGSYVGGTLAVIDKDSGIIDTRYMARINAYRYDHDGATHITTVIFTCTTPSTSGQNPFENFSSMNCEVLVMQPDPFDSRGVYPIYNTGTGRPTPDTSVPTFAIYPLIFSKGKDRASGIVDDAIGGTMTTMHYADPSVALNPFYIPTPGSEAFGLLIGSAIHDPSQPELGWYYGCHNDNITNHQLSTR